MNSILLGFIAAFLSTYFLMPALIKKLKSADITGRDMNKKNTPEVAEMGGIGIFAGFAAGMLLLIGLNFRSTEIISFLGVLSAVMLITLIGVIDDLLDIRQLVKTITPVPASIPLIVVRAGEKIMSFPLIGSVNLGRIYYGFIALGITGAANAVNMLAGLNGLEASLGVVASFSVLIAALLTNNFLGAAVMACLLGALIAFLKYNLSPAEVFPGDSGTLLIGGAIGAAVIAGNMERVGVIAFGLYFIELALKAKSGFKADCFGKEKEDGTLEAPEETGSLTHVVMNAGNFTEPQVVAVLTGAATVFGLLAVASVGM